MDKLFELSKINFSYHGTIPAITDVSLDVRKGEMLAVIGQNGSGKSTLLQIMCALLMPSSGKIRFRGKEITGKALRDRDFNRFFRSRVGIIFQNSDVQLFCPTVLDELMFGPLQTDIPPGKAMERCSEAMEMLGIERLADRPVHMLSGGEKKKVAIGSVLTMNPEVLLLDEPTGGLDLGTESFLTDLMLSLHEAGKTIVIATHDLELIGHLEPRIAVMSENHGIEKVGSVDAILRDTELLRKNNLVHEHVHRHGKKLHRHVHSHYLYHRHDD
ncbi:MAG: energy-coupling factor ABC transporter ATP-binding protein [Spirochaetes bacterium]|jgi:cobalt/nickel transport system ATP-binding protein|nr:energy-coupling factor ABC transporter ATP-binding protein [Spirochaetota bacterium]